MCLKKDMGYAVFNNPWVWCNLLYASKCFSKTLAYKAIFVCLGIPVISLCWKNNDTKISQNGTNSRCGYFMAAHKRIEIGER